MTVILFIPKYDFRCNIREGVAIYKNLVDYMRLVATENPKVLQDFIRQVNQKCAGVKVENVLLAEGDKPNMSDKLKKIVEKLKCMSEAISEAVKGTDYEGVFEEIKKDMEKVGERMKACTAESSKLEAAK